MSGLNYLESIKPKLLQYSEISSNFISKYHQVINFIDQNKKDWGYNPNDIHIDNSKTFELITTFINNNTEISENLKPNLINCIQTTHPKAPKDGHSIMSDIVGSSGVSSILFINNKIIPEGLEELNNDDSLDIHTTILDVTIGASSSGLSTYERLLCANVMSDFIIYAVQNNVVQTKDSTAVIGQYALLSSLFNRNAVFLKTLAETSNALYEANYPCATLA